MEQDNNKMKVRGRIIEIAQNTAALPRFCLTASLLNLISEEFFTKSQIKAADVRNQHYQLASLYLKHLQANAERLVKLMENFDLYFLDSEKIDTIVFKAIMRSDILDMLYAIYYLIY